MYEIKLQLISRYHRCWFWQMSRRHISLKHCGDAGQGMSQVLFLGASLVRAKHG